MPGKRIDLKYKKGKYSFSEHNQKTPTRMKTKPILTEENAQKLKEIVRHIKAKKIDTIRKEILDIDRKTLKNKNKLFDLQNNIEKINLKIKIFEKELKTDSKNKNILSELKHLKKKRDFLQIESNAIEIIIENLSQEKELANREFSDLKNPNKRRRFRSIKLKKGSLQNIFEALKILEKEGIISKEEYLKRATIFLKLQNRIKLTEIEKEKFEELATDPLFDF